MFHRHRTAAFFGLYSLISLCLLAWSADPVVQSLKQLTYYLWSPVGTPLVAQMDQWGRFGARMARLMRADQLVQELQDRWNQDQLNRAHLRTLEDENLRLRQLLGLPAWPRYRPVAARVWARDSADWYHSLLVRPSQSGVSAGAAVVAVQEGRPVALGQIREVFPDGKARVLLLTDPFSALSAHVGRTGEQGLAEGRGSDRILLNYLFSHSDAQPGDEVLTSGLGEIYPPNILIGAVERVEDLAGAGFRRCVVSPAARLGFLRDVLILERRDPPSGATSPERARP